MTHQKTRTVMLDVLVALLPAVIVSVWLFGWRALAVIAVCAGSCLLCEYLCGLLLQYLRRHPLKAVTYWQTVLRRVRKENTGAPVYAETGPAAATDNGRLSCLADTLRQSTVRDLSCVVTGLLLAMNLPVSLPLWQASLGGVIAIAVAKMLFGGLGRNLVNPAGAAFLVLGLFFSGTMNRFPSPVFWAGTDGAAVVTPMAVLAQGGDMADYYSMQQLFFGIHPGALGATCTAALLLGFIYLLIRRVVSPTIPFVFIGAAFLMTWILGGHPLLSVLSGGLMLQAIFMATDPATSPRGQIGKSVFAVGCGVLTALFQRYTSVQEGAVCAIVLMNLTVPVIDRFLRPKNKILSESLPD